MATISVIIPCYNAGSYIEKCLRALEQLALVAEEEKTDLESFLQALQGGSEEG